MFQVLFPLFKEHHKEIEDQAEKAKQSLKDKFGDLFKSDKKENGKEKENGKRGQLRLHTGVWIVIVINRPFSIVFP